MELLLATNNQFKQKEMLWHLEGLEGINLHYMSDLAEPIEVVEDGKTLLENAEKKAREISEQTDWYVLTSDAGVDIPGLGERWDMTRPKRIVGEHKDDLGKLKTLLEIMEGLSSTDRACKFHIALALGLKGQVVWSKEVEAEDGVIVETFDDRPISPNTWMARAWYYPEVGKTDEDLTPDQRSKMRQQHQSDMKQDLQLKIKALISSES